MESIHRLAVIGRAESWGLVMDQESFHYFQGREPIERSAADSTTSERVRQIHPKLAEAYAALVLQW